MRQNRHYPRTKGFTLVELMTGLMITAMVLCSLAVFSFGVSQSWMQSDSSQSTFLRQTLTVERLNHIVRQAQALEPNPTQGSLNDTIPSAACVLWTDTNNDGIIQYSELSMLQYLPTSHTLVQWYIPSSSGVATSIYTPSAGAPLMSQTSFMAMGPASLTLADNMDGCQFFSVPGVNTTSQMRRPSLEAVFKLDNGNTLVGPQVIYTSVALRAPILAEQ